MAQIIPFPNRENSARNLLKSRAKARKAVEFAQIFIFPDFLCRQPKENSRKITSLSNVMETMQLSKSFSGKWTTPPTLTA